MIAPPKAELVLPDGGVRRFYHGTRYGYVSGCHCERCTTANTVYQRDLLLKLKTREPYEHGTASTYANWGCRCDPCRNAHRSKRER